jgi:hypothetical protein
MTQRPTNIETERLILVVLLPDEIGALVANDAERAAILTGHTFLPHEMKRAMDLDWHRRALRGDSRHLPWRIRVIVERVSNAIALGKPERTSVGRVGR